MKGTNSGIVNMPFELRVVVVWDPSDVAKTDVYVCGGVVICQLVRRLGFGHFTFFKRNLFRVKLEFVEEWDFFLVFLLSRWRNMATVAREVVGETHVSLNRSLPADCIIRTSLKYYSHNQDVFKKLIRSLALHPEFPKIPIQIEV